jgi:hypothetical protein
MRIFAEAIMLTSFSEAPITNIGPTLEGFSITTSPDGGYHIILYGDLGKFHFGLPPAHDIIPSLGGILAANLYEEIHPIIQTPNKMVRIALLTHTLRFGETEAILDVANAQEN